MKRLPTDHITDINEAWVLPLFENCFQYRMWYFLSKGVDLFDPFEIFMFVTRFEKKTFRSFAHFARFAFNAKTIF